MKLIFIFLLNFIGIFELYAFESNLPKVIQKNERLSSIEKISAKKFIFKGNNIISYDDLHKLVESYENRIITPEELQNIKVKITQYYVDLGYINSGAIIPDQDVSDGNITIEIIEGKLDQIYVTGLKRLKPSYIVNRVKLATNNGKLPLNVNTLQERLKLIKQDSLIENVNAELKPGLEKGKADVYLNVKEKRPYSLELKFNNYSSPGVGAYTGSVEASFLNITGWGDSISAETSKTQGTDHNYSAIYSIPVTKWGTTISVSASENQSEIVSEPFNELDIYGFSRNYAFSVSHPVYKNLAEEFNIGLKFEKKYSKTYLFNLPFSFSEGVNNGESRVSAFRFWQEWVKRTLVQVIALRSNISVGVDMLDATIKKDKLFKTTPPDGQFKSWLGQMQVIRMLNTLNSQLLLSLNLQLSYDKLLPMEKFTIGGSSTVRGYRENFITSDNGFISSIEWRVPVTHWIIPNVGKYSDKYDIKTSLFADYGTAWNTNTSQRPTPDSIYSVGLGVRGTFFKHVETSIDWALRLREVDNPSDKDLQDSGIHFQIKTIFP